MMGKMIGRIPERFDSISNNMDSIVTNHKLPLGSTRMDRLLGLGVCPHSAAVLEPNDVNEFIEEDVWGNGDGSKHDNLSFGVKEKAKSGATHTKLGRSRRRLSVDSGLSLAFGETGRTGIFSALSSLNRGSGHSWHGLRRDGTPSRSSTVSRFIPHIATNVDNGRLEPPQSAPLSVPDWSGILRMDQTGRKQERFADFYDDDWERLPPHELLALEHARNRIIAFSMFEGAGRTLKGRDLSRVRNAVLRQTGFIEC